jgi:hypothetical protein
MGQSLAALQSRTFARATAATAESYPEDRRLTGDQLATYLDRRSFAVVSTARPDGRPHAAMSSFLRRDTVFWLPTVEGSVRAANLRRQPWTSLIVTEGDHEAHIVVIVEGTAELVDAADAPSDIGRESPGDWARLWIRLPAERLLSYAAEGAL